MSAKEKLSSLILEAEAAWYEDGDGDKNRFIAGYLLNHFGPLKGTVKPTAKEPTAGEIFVSEYIRLDKECRRLLADLILGV